VELLRDEGQVSGVRLRDEVSNSEIDVHAAAVVNATGAWADQLRAQVGGPAKLRPLRGSHLVFPHWRLPAAQAISFSHPADGRAVFILPWDGVTLVGTTDLDHEAALETEPRISGAEVAYLLAALDDRFPVLNLTPDDVIATFAGVRPVLDTGKADPSKEARDHMLLDEKGLLTVTGGKLTIFRVIARETVAALAERLPQMAPAAGDEAPIYDEIADDLPATVALTDRRRLLGRYGHDARALVAAAEDGELALIPGTTALWAEVRWAARAEGVVHLDDLLLRRVRVGLLLPAGGAGNHDRLRAICQEELGWDDATWENEWTAYQTRWHAGYGLPPRSEIPDWRVARPQPVAVHRPVRQTRALWAALVLSAAALGLAIYRFQKQAAEIRE
jgi:glycerol-3-phosphate dehydrogenase